VGETARLAIKDCFCHNSACPDHGKRSHGNVYFRGWRPRQAHPHGLLPHLQEVLFRAQGHRLRALPTPPDKVVSVLDHIREGCGVRATSCLTGVSRATISRYIALAESDDKVFTERLAVFSLAAHSLAAQAEVRA